MLPLKNYNFLHHWLLIWRSFLSRSVFITFAKVIQQTSAKQSLWPASFPKGRSWVLVKHSALYTLKFIYSEY